MKERKIKAIVIDDEVPALDLIAFYISKIDQIQLTEKFNSAEKALLFLKQNKIDLIFLDIEMTNMSGLDFAKKIDSSTKIIFSTAFDNYAIDGFNLSAVDYILKPYSFERFQMAVDKAIKLISLEKNQFISHKPLSIKVNYKTIQIHLEDVIYIECVNNNITIHLISSETLTFREPLKLFIEKLPKDIFIRIHRSFVVSKINIEKYSNSNVTIKGLDLPISSLYKESFLAWIRGEKLIFKE